MKQIKNRRSSSILLALGMTSILALSACGGETTVGDGAEASSAPATSAAASDAASPDASPAGDFPTPDGGELNLYNWTDYISPELIERFESETGITVILDNFDSNETLLSKLQAGGANYDVIVPSDYMVAQMIELGVLQEVDPAAFPNGQFIKPEFMDVYFDPGRKYSAPLHVRHDRNCH